MLHVLVVGVGAELRPVCAPEVKQGLLVWTGDRLESGLDVVELGHVDCEPLPKLVGEGGLANAATAADQQDVPLSIGSFHRSNLARAASQVWTKTVSS
jgi:hypothetical protein